MKNNILWNLAVIFFIIAITFVIANFICKYDNAIMIAEGVCYTLGILFLIIAIISHNKRKQRETEERLVKIINDFKKYKEDENER